MSSPENLIFKTMRAKYFPFTTQSGFTIRPVSAEELVAFSKANYDLVFPHAKQSRYFNLPQERVSRIKPLIDSYRLCHHEYFIFYDRDETPVGWHMSDAEDSVTFYLRNTGILPAYRNKGIYREFSARLEAYLRSLGYERLTSNHQSTNRDILIRKLKDGFCISGLELTERWGPLVKMVKILAEDREQSFYSQYGSLEHLK